MVLYDNDDDKIRRFIIFSFYFFRRRRFLLLVGWKMKMDFDVRLSCALWTGTNSA